MSAVFIPTRAKLTTEQFHRMGDAGILPPEDRIELIDGDLIEMAPIGSQHAWTVIEINRIISKLVGDSAVIAVQSPIKLSKYDEPQPDIMLLRLKVEGYRNALPVADDALLIIEVSDSSLDYDRNKKLPLYARHGVEETWIVNVAEKRLEVYRDPFGETYRSKQEHNSNEIVSPQLLPGLKFELKAILY
jgi:Uma2 family endonuclease